jgi:hypothetical protein
MHVSMNVMKLRTLLWIQAGLGPNDRTLLAGEKARILKQRVKDEIDVAGSLFPVLWRCILFQPFQPV